MKRMMLYFGIITSIFFFFLPFLNAQGFPEKQVYSLDLVAVSVPALDLRCKEDVTALLTIQNSGTIDALVSAEIVQDELSVDSISPSVRIFAGEQQVIPLSFTIEKMTQGQYLFTIHLFTEKGIRSSAQSFSFAGCKKPSITSLILSSSDTSFVTSPILLPKEDQPRNDIRHLTLTLFLLGILAVLSLLFLFRTSVQEYFRRYN